MNGTRQGKANQSVGKLKQLLCHRTTKRRWGEQRGGRIRGVVQTNTMVIKKCAKKKEGSGGRGEKGTANNGLVDGGGKVNCEAGKFQ